MMLQSGRKTAMATTPRLISYEEWLRMPTVEDGTDEVVRGVYRFMPPTHYPHAEIIQRLIARWIRQVDEKKVGILGSNFGLMIGRDPLTCRSPDLMMFWRDRMEIVDGLYVSPPGLVVEIISPSENRRRKMGKIEDYFSIGVPEVWLVEPKQRIVEAVFHPDPTANPVGEVLEPRQFPGVRVPVSEIWPA